MHCKGVYRLNRSLAILMVCMMVLVFLPVQSAHSHAAQIGTGVCTASSLNVRTGPSSSYSKMGSIKRGTRVVVYDQRNGWYQIAFGNSAGWCSGKYINFTASTDPDTGDTTDSPDAIGQGIVRTSGGSLNVRSGPSTGYAKLGSLPNRASVVIYETKSGWYRIVYNSKTAWIYGSYVAFTPITPNPGATPTPSTPAPTPTTPATPTPTPAPSATSSSGIGTGKVSVSSSLNVRSGPGTSYSRIGKVYNGNVLTVYSVRSGWVELDYKGRHGWVSDGYIKVTLHSSNDDQNPQEPSPDSPDTIGTGICSVSTSLNVRSGPSTSYSKVGSIPRGANVNILTVSGSWYRIEYKGLIGWCSAPYIVASFSSDDTPDSIVEAVSVYSYAAMQQDIQALRARYPDQISVSSIGTSVEGRDLPVLIVGDSDARFHILIHAGIHGRENMNCNLVMMQIEYMLANPSTVYDGQTFEQWMSDVSFHIIPMVNPDGIAISQTKSGSEDILAICTLNLVGSSELSTYLSHWKANAHGVDLNLQFPSGWDEKESASLPAGVEYKGEAPFSEPEALALKAYTESRSFDITISYHSTGSVLYINFPLATDAANAKCLSLGQTVSNLTGYTIRDTPITEGAGYKDWVLSEHCIPSLTIETGTTSCPLPLSQFAGIWTKNKYLWPVLTKWAQEND